MKNNIRAMAIYANPTLSTWLSLKLRFKNDRMALNFIIGRKNTLSPQEFDVLLPDACRQGILLLFSLAW